ncbi:MAG: hypothetical protein ACREMB_25860, partial [Candidatus Rokuibacteriota bacterium]
AQPRPPAAEQRVCVYALVILASSPPAGDPKSGRAPTPALKAPGGTRAGQNPENRDDWAGPRAPGGGCGRPVRLQPWVPRLREVFGYSAYEPMSAFEMIMPLGTIQRFALPGGRELQIQPLAIRRPIVRMAVKVFRGPVSEIATVMDVPPRRPALIGGPPHGPGVLIIAIRSRAEP